jgi:hypothetical protein
MLHDLKRLLDRHEDLSEADFKEAANTLLTRQFLYLDDDRRHYRLISDYFEYFRDLFEALGWQLYQDRDFAYVGVLPGDDETFQRLDLTETLFLFVARLAFEEGVAARQTQDGLVHLGGDALLERYLALTHRDAPKKGDFVELLKRFKRHGLLRFGEEDAASGLPRLALLPALRQVAGDRCLERLEAHIAKTARDEEPDAIGEGAP